MKTYFAKFVPVEGDMKDGDLFIERDTLGKDTLYTYDGPLCLQPHDHLVSRTKVKLFLCSRAIQVGDKCWTTVGGCFDIFKEDYDRQYWFKVIGEISPDVTWVTEGDEFKFGKVDKNDYICPYNQEDEKYIKFWTERGFRDLPTI